MEKKFMRQVDYLQGSYQDTRSTKHKKVSTSQRIKCVSIIIIVRVFRMYKAINGICVNHKQRVSTLEAKCLIYSRHVKGLIMNSYHWGSGG